MLAVFFPELSGPSDGQSCSCHLTAQLLQCALCWAIWNIVRKLQLVQNVSGRSSDVLALSGPHGASAAALIASVLPDENHGVCCQLYSPTWHRASYLKECPSPMVSA